MIERYAVLLKKRLESLSYESEQNTFEKDPKPELLVVYGTLFILSSNFLPSLLHLNVIGMQ
jgi:hypothetical protein